MFLPDNVEIDSPDGSIISIENPSHLFQGWAPGFWVEQVDDHQFDEEPCNVDDVVLPTNGSEGDWIDVIVEEESSVDAEEHDRQAFRSQGEWYDFDGVCDKESRPGNRVRETVKNKHANDRIASGMVLRDVVSCGADCHCGLH